MSIIRPIVRSVVRSIANSIVGASVTRWFSIFGGNHIELGQILTPTTANFVLEFTIRPAAGDVGANTTILSQHSISAPRVLTSGTDQLRVIYITTSAGSVTLNGNVPIELDTDMHVRFENDSVTGTKLTINGGTPTTSTGVADHTLFSIDMIGSRHDHGFNFQGQIWDVSIPNGTGFATYPIDEASGLVVADNSYVGAFDQLPRSEWVEGNGVDIFGSFSPVTLAGDFIIEWEEVRGDSLAGNDQTATFGASGAGEQILLVKDSGNAAPNRVGLNSTPEFNTFSTALVGVSVGDNYSGRFARESGTLELFTNNVLIGSTSSSATYIFDQIMQSQTSHQKTSPQGIHRLTDSAGNTYEWRLNEVIDIGGGQGYVANSGTVGDTGVSILDEQFNGSTTMSGNDVTDTYPTGDAILITLDVASSGKGMVKNLVTEVGALYRITTRRVGGSANTRLKFGSLSELGITEENIVRYATTTGTSTKFELLVESAVIGATIEHDFLKVEKVNGIILNNWAPADQTLVTAPTDGIWTAEPTRVQR